MRLKAVSPPNNPQAATITLIWMMGILGAQLRRLTMVTERIHREPETRTMLILHWKESQWFNTNLEFDL